MSDNTFNEKLVTILTKLENIVSQDTAQRISGNGGRISPKRHHNNALYAIEQLVLNDVIGEDEAWNVYPDPSEASTRNELKAEMRQRLQEYIK